MNNFYITLLFHVIKSAVVVVGIFKRIKGEGGFLQESDCSRGCSDDEL